MPAIPHPHPISGASYSAAELMPDNDRLILLDQRRLPDEEHYTMIENWRDAARAISDMVVRGAPAIGIAAAYAMVLASHEANDAYGPRLMEAAAGLKQARPTAVNLAWAVEKCLALALAHEHQSKATRTLEMAELARRMHEEDVAANRTLGRIGATQVPDGATILTHCNAGALATGGYGTALGVVRAAREAGKKVRVLADETRPYLQGSRLTAWELAQDGIDVTLIADSAAGALIARGEVDLAVVGSDRIAANGDVANKIGTYAVACLCHYHARPFLVAAPFSTVDLATPSGAEIPIEERSSREVTDLGGKRLAPQQVRARNPAFDVTPAAMVTAIVTERGLVSPVDGAGLAELAQRQYPPNGKA